MHLKGVIRIELYQLGDSHIGSSVHVCYSPSDSVLSIKQKLQLLTGIPALSQTLSHATTQLSDSDTLHSLSISRNAIPTLHMHIPIRGGACKSSALLKEFSFLDITSESCFEIKQFATSGPNYMYLIKGINFTADCKNSQCISFNPDLGYGRVIVQKGLFLEHRSLGTCNFRREMINNICPACKKSIGKDDIVNLAIYDCSVDIEWGTVDGESGEFTTVCPNSVYKTLKPEGGFKQYEYLILYVE